MSARRWARQSPRSAIRTFDVYLNGEAFWRNVPAAVWNYRLGGYQVLKKWLSYREHAILGRAGEVTEEVTTLYGYVTKYRSDYAIVATSRNL